MNTETMYVNPNELVIDMPVDEANVQLKMQSLQTSGLIQPITVWLQGLRIVDGFHRAVAAQRLGWDSVLCHVIDCNEEAFWDARIQSARQHHAIENDRLAEWMYQAWKQTEWYEPNEKRPGFSMLKRMGEILVLKQPGWSEKLPGEWGGALSVRKLNSVEQDIFHWLSERSTAWGIGVEEISDRLGKYIWQSIAPNNPDFDDKARECGLSWEDALLARSLVGYVDHKESYDVDKWLKREFIPNRGDSRIFREWRRQEEEAERKKEAEDRQREHERRRQWEQSPQGQAAIEKQRAEERLRTLTDGIAYARRSLESTSYVIDSVPEAPALLAGFAQFVVEFAKLDDAKVNAVALENAKLRDENKQLKERIESLERALAAKQSVAPRIADTVALSSVEMGN